MTVLKGILVAGIVAYATILAIMFFAQRRLMYIPDTQRIAPADAGFARARVQDIKTEDGETLIAWYVAPAPGKALILYFHGNAGQIAGRADRFATLTASGNGLLAASYRGFGGSSGAPDERGLIADARVAYAHVLAAGIAPARIIIMGESLGSGVAVALGAEVSVAGIVLEAPFSSTVDVARSIYWMFPVGLLMRDQFRSDLRIARITAPLLIVHGSADPVVPLRFGEKLFALAPEPRTFWRVDAAGHQPLDNAQIAARVEDWINSVLR